MNDQQLESAETPAGATPSPDQLPEQVEVDVDVDERETEDPAAYWRSVRTRSQIDHDVMTRVLSPREAAFVIEYTHTPEDARSAAIRAGYSHNSAHVQADRLRSRARVAAAIAREFARKAAQTGVDQGYLIGQCRDIAEDSSVKAGDRLRAVELMAKLTGSFAPEKVEHSHSGLTWADIAAEEAEDAQVIDVKGIPHLSGDDNPA